MCCRRKDGEREVSSKKRPARKTAASRSALRTPIWLKVATIAGVAVIFGLFILSRQASPTMQPTANIPPLPSVGSKAPNGTFTTISGKTVSVASLRGKPTLLWFVTTWCPTCQASTKTLAQNISVLAKGGVRVVEVELYDDLGTPGPTLQSFGRGYAGAAFHSPNWIWGVASKSMSETYDPAGYLDIYYVVDAKGRIRYVNSAPVQTMRQIKEEISRLSGGTPSTSG